MKKSYQIEVDCAACAQKMEEATKRTEGVKDCVVNFMTQKMNVEFADGADRNAVMKNVLVRPRDGDGETAVLSCRVSRHRIRHTLQGLLWNRPWPGLRRVLSHGGCDCRRLRPRDL